MEQLLNPGTLIFLIPLAAIIGAFVVKLRKMEIQRTDGANDEVLRSVQRELISLKRRMENIETIVAGDEPEKRTQTSHLDERDESDDSLNDQRLRNMLR
ncbi:MAG TPA: hypothetical protein VKA08_05315 [Balneolales bacterium]|nr:hypothetical protein [Balneolales bacterium]